MNNVQPPITSVLVAKSRGRTVGPYVLDRLRKIVHSEPAANETPESLYSVKQALLKVKSSYVAAAVFSGFINLLMLSGSLYMLQVYDRVLPSQSMPTLIALVILVVVLYILQSLLTLVRSLLFARIGQSLDMNLRQAVFDINLHMGMPGQAAPSSTPFRDLEQVRSFLSSGGPSAIFDLPWMPLYLLILALIHPYLGILGLIGIGLMTALAWHMDRVVSPVQKASSAEIYEANAMADAARLSAETIKPLGMARGLGAHWLKKNEQAGESVIRSSDLTSKYGAVSQFVRMTLQSTGLTVGAYLVIVNEATGGVMIAASILLGRALAPVDASISHWRNFVGAREAYYRLEVALRHQPPAVKTALPIPQRELRIESLILTTPQNKPILYNINVDLVAGDALAIVGPSGAGKSTLVRALAGVWPVAKGSIRFDGSTLDQWLESDIGSIIGYLPQSVELFTGTVAQNISRFAANPDANSILRAAQMAGVEGLVRQLEKGFDTEIGYRGATLSAGQKQRIALARALYGDPFALILDEPNSALDSEGEQALIEAIFHVRSRRGVVVMVSHRPNVLQPINKVLMLADGEQKAFGPRDEIFQRAMRPGQPKPESAA